MAPTCSLRLYTDRIEVISPGGLPKGMTLADLGRKSIRRNALIADLLHRIEFIEKAGTGIRRIRDEVREQGCPEPEFETNGFFTAIFRPNPDVRAHAGVHKAHVEAQSGHSRSPVNGEVTPQGEEMLKEWRNVLAIKRRKRCGPWVLWTCSARTKQRCFVRKSALETPF
ncbi:MAG: hypothetical protein LWX52_11070 [Deltaproteobacteria bacterium]|nr:hypothetical protein [Deltaproteobacteria bacterium]